VWRLVAGGGWCWWFSPPFSHWGGGGGGGSVVLRAQGGDGPGLHVLLGRCRCVARGRVTRDARHWWPHPRPGTTPLPPYPPRWWWWWCAWRLVVACHEWRGALTRASLSLSLPRCVRVCSPLLSPPQWCWVGWRGHSGTGLVRVVVGARQVFARGAAISRLLGLLGMLGGAGAHLPSSLPLLLLLPLFLLSLAHDPSLRGGRGSTTTDVMCAHGQQ
jgi:hypothetical protein